MVINRSGSARNGSHCQKSAWARKVRFGKTPGKVQRMMNDLRGEWMLLMKRINSGEFTSDTARHVMLSVADVMKRDWSNPAMFLRNRLGIPV